MINNISLNTVINRINTLNNSPKNRITDTSPNLTLNPSYPDIIKNYNYSLISFTGNLDKSDLHTVKQKAQIAAYQRDNAYRQTLAENIGCNENCLKTVVGTNELKYVLENVLSPESFSNGSTITNGTYQENGFENVKNSKFIANMHIHTLYSDGQMSVSDVLDQAAAYADKNNTFMYIAITDHDSYDGVKKALTTIADNPKKYENVRFIPGIEMNTYYGKLPYEDKKSKSHPAQLELIGYCINPYDKKIEDFLSENGEKNHEYAKNIINQINESINTSKEDSCSLQEAINSIPIIKIGGSPRFITDLFKYIEDKFDSTDEWNAEELNEIKKSHCNNYGSINITPGTEPLETISEILIDNGAIFGMAHPGRNYLGLNSDGNPREMDDLLDILKKCGSTVIEGNYQYMGCDENTKMNRKKYPGQDDSARRSDLLQAGGNDNHRNNIFCQRDLSTDELRDFSGISDSEISE